MVRTKHIQLMTLLPIAIPKCSITQTGASLDESLTYEDWSHIGAQLSIIHGCSMWWIGDWLKFGVKQYGDRTKAAMQNSGVLGYQPKTLLDAIRVSDAIEDTRRLASLSWSHHQLVAPLEAKDQDRWLEHAEANHLSVSDLRGEIRTELGEKSAHEPDGPTTITAGSKLDDVRTFLINLPQDWWNEDRKATWKARLRPLVDFYSTL